VRQGSSAGCIAEPDPAADVVPDADVACCELPPEVSALPPEVSALPPEVSALPPEVSALPPEVSELLPEVAGQAWLCSPCKDRDGDSGA
jgi:hypothetical protein